MSVVNVTIPEDGWFQSGDVITPQDKQLCIIVHQYGEQTPLICQYRKADWICRENDYFLDISEYWRLQSLGCESEWEPSFLAMNLVKIWKPLALPSTENNRIILEIEKLLEE